MTQSPLRRFAQRLPTPVRRWGARVRNGVYRNILSRQRRRSTPGESFSLHELLNVLYPEELPAGLHLDELAVAAAGGLRVRDLATVRRVLAALDGPSAPSPVHVRQFTFDLDGVTWLASTPSA